jgi:hypothetical protein
VPFTESEERSMKLGMIIDYAGGFAETVELVPEYERNGLELVAMPERQDEERRSHDTV